GQELPGYPPEQEAARHWSASQPVPVVQRWISDHADEIRSCSGRAVARAGTGDPGTASGGRPGPQLSGVTGGLAAVLLWWACARAAAPLDAVAMVRSGRERAVADRARPACRRRVGAFSGGSSVTMRGSGRR